MAAASFLSHYPCGHLPYFRHHITVNVSFLPCDGSSDRSFMVYPLSYFSFQPVLHDWCNKGRGICYPVCGMMHIKEPLLLIGKSSPYGGSGFPLSLSGHLPYVRHLITVKKRFSGSLNTNLAEAGFLSGYLTDVV